MSLDFSDIMMDKEFVGDNTNKGGGVYHGVLPVSWDAETSSARLVFLYPALLGSPLSLFQKSFIPRMSLLQKIIQINKHPATPQAGLYRSPLLLHQYL